jgi:hypothetical protein
MQIDRVIDIISEREREILSSSSFRMSQEKREDREAKMSQGHKSLRHRPRIGIPGQQRRVIDLAVTRQGNDWDSYEIYEAL